MAAGCPLKRLRPSCGLYGSKEFRGRRRVLITAVAAMSNLSRETLYQARRGIMSDRTRVLLSRAISSIENLAGRYRR